MLDWPACAALLRRRMEGRTQIEVAPKVGIKGPYLSQILRGKKVPTLPLFAALCRVLGVLPNEIAAMLGAGGTLPRVAEQPSRYKAEPPATVEVSQDGATLTIVVHVKPQRTRPHNRSEEEP